MTLKNEEVKSTSKQENRDCHVLDHGELERRSEAEMCVSVCAIRWRGVSHEGGVCYLCPRLARAVGTDELHELFERVLMVVVADGGVGEIWTGLLDDGGGRKMKGRG